MEGQSDSGQFQYLSQNWSPVARRNTYTASTPLSSPSVASAQHFPSPLDQLSTLLPQQSAAFQAQLANYNKLIASGGRSSRVQSSPLPPQFSSGQVQAVPRKPSWNNDSSSSPRSSARGHANKKSPNIGKGERSPMTTEDNSARMSDKRFDIQKQLPSRPLAQHHNTSISQQSSSVPSTPHQRPRKYSLTSREPSPTALPNHSPRSAYSETNSTLPSLRPLPPRFGGCKYETAMQYSRRRMAYSIGTDKLETIKLEEVKPNLTEDDERKLTTDMRELYDRILPTPEGEANRKKFVQKLELIMNTEWPGHNIKVHMFGSSGNMLCTDESDVDICITTDPEWKELESVCKLAELLARNGMQKVICVNSAKVPIVKVWDPELNLACDMNVNNTLALENTRMIKTYIQIDERVRPLAMIIKHWTKRRIVNDAAFGGTLSSYTWICMIINFLQTRSPAVIPALHQRPHNKLKSKDNLSTFGDDVEALKSFGSGNKENIAELLFHFFRFYAHEMDYDTKVVSVRQGKLLTKAEKGWQHGNNNTLCVEEPFNVGRNLGNTADDTSFRGLHVELRRAFDLIAEGKLEECCEEYVYPKEEERIWERPVPQPKPTLTPAYAPGGKGRGRWNGTRGNRNNNGSRRTSGAFENHSSQQPFMHLPQPYVSAEWLQAQSQMHADLSSQLSQLKAQENNLRNMLYHQSQQYAQMQSAANHQTSRNGGLAPAERNRGNSFDNAPLTAPLRSDQYFYPMLQPSMGFGPLSPSTYPSSPLMSPALPDIHRGSRVASISSTNGGTNGAGSALRSQSQPATRNMQASAGLQAAPMPNHMMNGYFPYAYQQQPSGVSSVAVTDDTSSQAESMQSATISVSPPNSQIPKEYVGYYVNPVAYTPRKEPMVLSTIPTYSELKQNRPRRPSTDQFPHAIFDRVRRTSRSPSPLGHNRQYSTDTNGTLLSGKQAPSQPIKNTAEQGPAIVNGSMSIPAYKAHQPSSLSGSSASEEHGFESVTVSTNTLSLDSSVCADVWGQSRDGSHLGLAQTTIPAGPAVVNGSSQGSSTSKTVLGLGITNGIPINVSNNQNLVPADSINGSHRLSPNVRQRLNRPHQNGGVSPLDISQSHNDLSIGDMPHLSPVYETRTPSPTANRKPEVTLDSGKIDQITGGMSSKSSEHNAALKLALSNAQKPNISSSKSNGHTRNVKSEGAGLGSGWQKPKQKGNKKLQAPVVEHKFQASAQPFSESAPKKDSDRKGG